MSSLSSLIFRLFLVSFIITLFILAPVKQTEKSGKYRSVHLSMYLQISFNPFNFIRKQQSKQGDQFKPQDRNSSVTQPIQTPHDTTQTQGDHWSQMCWAQEGQRGGFKYKRRQLAAGETNGANWDSDRQPGQDRTQTKETANRTDRFQRFTCFCHFMSLSVLKGAYR